MASSYTVIFALALLVELTTRSTTALPKIKMDEERTDQDGVVSIAGEDGDSEMGPGQLTFRRPHIIEGRLVDEDGTKRIFILAVSVCVFTLFSVTSGKNQRFHDCICQHLHESFSQIKARNRTNPI